MPELSQKKITIRFDGRPPQTSTEEGTNKYPENKDLDAEVQSEIFGGVEPYQRRGN